MPPQKVFAENDEVMVFDKGKMYKSRILKVQVNDMNVNYFIHFDGWKRKYDAWIDSHICCPIGNEEAMQNFIKSLTQPGVKEGKKKDKDKDKEKSKDDGKGDAAATETEGSQSAMKAKGGSKSVSVAEDSLGTSKKKRSFVDMSDSNSSSKIKELLLEDLIDDDSDDVLNKIPIIVPLKRHLIEDWTCITKDPKKLLKLPKQAYNVERIISDFLAEKQKQDKTKKEASSELYPEYKELSDGLIDYFNQALPRILLYRQEISQYEALLVHCRSNSRVVSPRISSSSSSSSSSRSHDSSSSIFIPSKVYGAEHLLRLFVRMPKLMIGMAITKEEISQIIFRFSDLLKFIHKHMSTYLDLSEYVLVEEALAIASNQGNIASTSAIAASEKTK